MQDIDNHDFNIKNTMPLKEICDLCDVHHSNTMKRIMPEMLKNQDFGLAAQIVQPITSGKGRTQEIVTYLLNKNQSLIMAARLNSSFLIR